MALDFPNFPAVGAVFVSGPKQWVWDGAKWDSAAVAQVLPYLPLAGGTLTGLLTIDLDGGDPVPPLPALLPGTMLELRQADGAVPRINLDGFGGPGAVLSFRAARGTSAAPTAVGAGDALGTVSGFGYGLTGYSSANRANLRLEAAEGWTDAAQGTQITINLTAAGTTTTAAALTLTPTLLTLGGGLTVPGAATVGGSLGVSGTVTVGGDLSLGNNHWLLFKNTSGTPYQVIGLWTDNHEYIGSGLNPTVLRGTALTLQGTIASLSVGSLSVGSLTSSGSMTATGEIRSTGSGAILSFMDRTTNNQWGWYAQGDIARLFYGPNGDRVTIGTQGSITIPGEFITTAGSNSWGVVRMIGGAYGAFFRQDGANLYILLTNANDPYGQWNGLRPFMVNLGSGRCTIGNGLTMVNATYIYGFDTSGNERYLVTFWNDNQIYVGDSSFNMHLRGATVYLDGPVSGSAGITCPGEVSGSHSLATSGYVWINGIELSNNGGWMYTGYINAGNDIAANGYLRCGGTGGPAWSNNGGWMYTGSPLNTASDFAANGVVRVGGTGGPYWQNNSGWMYTPNGNMQCSNDCIAPGVFRRSPVGGARGANLECPGWDWDGIGFFMSQGVLYATSDRAGSAFYFISSGTWSDAELKTDIRGSEIDALAILNQTPVRAFAWTAEALAKLPPRQPEVEIGLVAQELEELIPEAVGVAELNGRYIDFKMLTPYLVRAVQQLTERLAKLEDQIGRHP